MKLSIIIPYYNLKPYTDELLDCLAPQVTDEVEVLVIDDGSKEPYKTKYKWATVLRKENGGVSSARNFGLDNSTGEYITFIDADDLVADDYIKQIIEKIDTEHFDYLEMSWDSLAGGAQWSQKLYSINDSLPNPSVCTRAFKRTTIGKLRFNEKKFSTEDDEFKRKLYFNMKNKKKAVITDYLYHYRTSVENSKSKRFMNGELPTKRIVYYFNHVRRDMDYLIPEIAKEDEYHEVWVLTNQNDLPELGYYAHIKKPHKIAGMELRGEPFSSFTLIKQALRTQVVIWTAKTFEIGGIESFIYNFCMTMKDDYDITVLYNLMAESQIDRLEPYVQVVKNDVERNVVCDTLIVNRLTDVIPSNIRYKQVIQMCHTCNEHNGWTIPQNRDRLICVSDASKSSFDGESDKGIVIRNPLAKMAVKTSLLLVSATRLDTADKGQKRMLKLARELNNAQIPFLWLYFSNVELENAPHNMICMSPRLDVANYIAMADYLVQLSSYEAFCYSIVESLSCGVPVICTDLPVLPEIGVKDGENAYVVPMDIAEKYPVEEIYNNRLKGKFQYAYDNDGIRNQWKEVLGDTKPIGNYVPEIIPKVKVLVKVKYFDIQLKRQFYPDDEYMMKSDRAYYLQNVKHFVEILE